MFLETLNDEVVNLRNKNCVELTCYHIIISENIYLLYILFFWAIECLFH